MVKITNTNIIVDDFYFSKVNDIFKSNIYFLTHMHSDHYKGLSNDWNLGKIYCSKVTAILLKEKFKNLENICGLELNKYYEINLKENNNDDKFKVKVYLMDSNHILGSVMILFKGYMGNILHTGDFKYTNSMLYEQELFYNKQKRLHIDELYLDNTFCDKVFVFPDKLECEKSIIELISNHNPKKVQIIAYSLGKEEIGVSLSKYYNTKIVVSKERYRMLKLLNYNLQHFTYEEDNGFIYLVSIEDKNIDNDGDGLLRIRMTGWANTQRSLKMTDSFYVIPYSSHSNYNEIEEFVSHIRPSVIRPIVFSGNKKQLEIKNLNKNNNFMNTLRHIKQSGLEYLRNNFTDMSLMSNEYKYFFNNNNCINFERDQSEINQKLFENTNKNFCETIKKVINDRKIYERGVKFNTSIKSNNNEYAMDEISSCQYSESEDCDKKINDNKINSNLKKITKIFY